MNLSEEVRDLIAGLTGGNRAEPSVHDELRRLRWVFTGSEPTFLPRDQMTLERLDASGIGLSDVKDAFGKLATSLGRDPNSVDWPLFEVLYLAWAEDPGVAPRLTTTDQRLRELQDYFSRIEKILRNLNGWPAW
jgi:hypothetical protein